ncbi:MAG: DUF433 domain-containing protein [Planctomycetaceae bacterium]
MTTLTHAHITLNAEGVPIISGTTMKVVELVGFHLHQGWDARELREQFPHLTLGQIHSALSFFHDHEAEILEDLARREQFEDDVQRELGDSPLREKLLRARQGQA